MSYKADSERIVRNNWPEWRLVDGTTWQREWHVELTAPPARTDFPAMTFEEGELFVECRLGPGPKHLVVTTTTEGNRFSDELFFFSAHRMLRRIESAFGEIESIQGQARSLWPPFRAPGAERVR